LCEHFFLGNSTFIAVLPLKVTFVKIKKEPVDYDENQSTGSKASSDVIGNVRSFLERKATDFNQNQSSGAGLL
jgi:hypothetical protein